MWFQKPGDLTISSHLSGLLLPLAHTLLLADVRWCRAWVWTAEMFIEWRKLGDAMRGLAGLVMLEKTRRLVNMESSGAGGAKSGHAELEFCGHPDSQNSQADGKDAHSLCPVALLPCLSMPLSSPTS